MITITTEQNTAIVYADTLDSGAAGLIRALCASPAAAGSTIRVMPDVHAGKNCAVGVTMTVRDRVAPGLVGVDIGCGMTVCAVRGKHLELQKLDAVIRDRVPAGRAVRAVPHPFGENVSLDALHCACHIRREAVLCSVGTLGGGNHFIELDKGEDGQHYLIVHSGSRRLGASVAAFYQEAAHRQCGADVPYALAYVTGRLMEEYLHDMAIVQAFAAENRRAILREIVQAMKLKTGETFTTVHNYIDPDTMILRKGAVSAAAGERFLLPMNMRDGCLLCTGRGNGDWNQSAPHGAGRRMSRSDARSRFTLSQYKKEMAGIYTTSVSRETLDECPMAYKPMEEIAAAIAPTAEIVERLRPVYSFKAGEEARDR